MDKERRLLELNELISIAKECGCSVQDVYFGWGFDKTVIMSKPMPGAVRSRVNASGLFPIVVVDFDPHYGGWTSYSEKVLDQEDGICLTFPRPPELLEAHKQALSRRKTL